jgi:signal transduction histidine kinase
VRRIRVRLALAMALVAVLTAALSLPLALVYFERRLPPETAELVERQTRGGDFDGAFELAVLAAVAMGVGVAVGMLVAGRLARPLTALSAAARRVAWGDLAARPQVPLRLLRRADETGGLLRDFTAMAESLEQLDAERRTAAASVAHELRTPLTILQSRLEAARDGLLPIDDRELGTLLQQTRVLSRLVDDLRTVNLAEAGRLRLVPRPVDLGELAGRVSAGFRTAAVGRGVDVVVEATAVPAIADPDRVTQVLGNLLDNALRHTPAGGTVRVGVERTQAGAVLTVTDSGPGFPDDALGRVFDRFSRADAARSRATGGSGLGLAVVKALVELHGGRVEARNPGGGTGGRHPARRPGVGEKAVSRRSRTPRTAVPSSPGS